MCKALEDLYQDGVEEGLEKGIEKGIKVLVQDYIEEGYSKEIILDKLIRGSRQILINRWSMRNYRNS